MRSDANNARIGAAAGANQDSLVAAARSAAENAYAPYSHFRVGAALAFNNGAVVTGANVENASFGLTICAERSALVRAIAEHGPKIRIQSIAVVNLNDAASAPCGACRQMLSEFADAETAVIFPDEDGLRETTFGELLPHGFALKVK